jgi:DNA helicase IV
MINKEKILAESKLHLLTVSRKIASEITTVRAKIVKLSQRLKTLSNIEGQVEAVILANSRERATQLEQTTKSPYFVRCDLQFDNEAASKEYYFGKFQLTEENIYSWVAPIAQVRFGMIGRTKYKLPKGEWRTGELQRRDQFMIVDGQIKFLSSESGDYKRTLIYQEHFANKKSEFILPEIIAKMEQAQDEVIRAEHYGTFLIAGPAGSGKTTLAFHRIAYLVQSPDTAKLYPGWNIIVFVQDESTKKYFSAILPQLGIEEVVVTTFEEWALKVLNLSKYNFVVRFGADEIVRNEFEFYKNVAIKNCLNKYVASLEPKNILIKVYADYLPNKYQGLLQEQLSQNKLDRFDLTVLLGQKIVRDGQLTQERRVVTESGNGKLRLETKQVTLAYSFVVVDEAENYLAEQISIINSCLNDNKSMLYVGDLAQQTKLGTIRQWSEAGSEFTPERRVVLDKVYRNTKEILQYVKNQGYTVEIPEALRSGQSVIENQLSNLEELRSYIVNVIEKKSNELIGILYEPGIESEFAPLDLMANEQVKILSFNESQGVEFEVVLVIQCVDAVEVVYANKELAIEVAKIKRDLYYVALTRSMNELHIIKYAKK